MSSSIQAEFKALQDNQKMLVLLIFSLITVIIWVGASIINSQHTSSIEPELQAQGTPLNPSISTEILSEIEQKRVYSDQELSAFPIFFLRSQNQEISPFSLPPVSPSPVTRNSNLNTVASSAAEIFSLPATNSASNLDGAGL